MSVLYQAAIRRSLQAHHDTTNNLLVVCLLGIDMIGPLPTTLGGFNRVLVAIEKFTKWIDFKSVTCYHILDFIVVLRKGGVKLGLE
jgi:hypothetical protein